MEAFLLQIISEQWVIVWMFIWMLYFIIRAFKWGIWNYLDLIKEHNEKFLGRLDQIVTNNSKLTEHVIEWTNKHTGEHQELAKILEWVDEWVKKTNSNIKLLHEDILKLHK